MKPLYFITKIGHYRDINEFLDGCTAGIGAVFHITGRKTYDIGRNERSV